MISDQSESVEVEVRPFKHQVGGHTCVLEVTRSVICKPYVPREVWFYQHEPEELKEFTPKYLGEALVTCDIKEEKKCLVALVPESVVTYDVRQYLNHENASKAISSLPHGIAKKRRRSTSMSSTETNESGEVPGNLETWSKVCIDRQINRYGFWTNNQPQQFILLENLVHEYERPCLMDLKMGRRQFGDDSNEEKRKLLQSRCASSTSVSLGFRICGSQTFNVIDKTYVFHDKYVGRNLDVKGAQEELKSFFYNGIALRTDVVKILLSKLEKLRNVLMNQNLLFYSVSLLLLYDGASQECSSSDKSNDDVCEGLYHKPRSPEKLLLRKPEQKEELYKRSDTDEELTYIPIVTQTSEYIDKIVDSSNVNQEGLLCDNREHKSLDSTSAKVDVRMIDFAHVSQKQGGSEHVNVSADETILFGLSQLQKVLADILEETS